MVESCPLEPARVDGIIRKMYDSMGKSARDYYDGVGGMAEYRRELAQEMRGIERCDLTREYRSGIEHNVHGGRNVTPREFYIVWVYLRGGRIYRAKRIPKDLASRGIKAGDIVSCSERGDDECNKYIVNLHKDTYLLLYHGTDIKTAYEAVACGLDLNVPPTGDQERFNEVNLNTGCSFRGTGIYVTADFDVAASFGEYVLAFAVQAKHLYAPNWASAGFKTGDAEYAHEMKLAEYYPNSFRPSVSDFLKSGPSETQALLKRPLRPSDILRVWYDKQWHTKKEFAPAAAEEIRKEKERKRAEVEGRQQSLYKRYWSQF